MYNITFGVLYSQSGDWIIFQIYWNHLQSGTILDTIIPWNPISIIIYRYPPSPIHPLLQFLPRLKKWKLLRSNLHLFPSFRIPTGPVYDPYSFTKNEHNPRISTRPPLASSLAISLKNISTTAAACGLVKSVVSFNAWISWSLFMLTALLIVGLHGKWRVGIVDRIDLRGELCQEIDWL